MRAKDGGWAASRRVSLRPVAAYEIDVTSNAPEKDQIVRRVGLSSLLMRRDSTAPLESCHRLDARLLDNRGYHAKVRGSTLQYPPNYREVGIGRYLGHGAPVDFRWRPYIGVVCSDVKNAADVGAYQKLSIFHTRIHATGGEIRLTGRA